MLTAPIPYLIMRLYKSFFCFVFVVAAGCGEGRGGETVDGGTEDSANGDASTGPMGPGLAGMLKDEAGQPLGHEMVLACMATVCLFGDTDEDGRFFFPIEPPADVALKTPEDLTATPRRGAALCPVRIVDETLVDVGDLYSPDLPEGVPIGPADMDPQTLPAGDGLELTLRRADLTPRIGDILVDAAARRVPESQLCPFVVPADEEVVAVYALHPFAATSSSPIAVRAPSDLPPGTQVKFRTISEIDGHLSEPVPGQANGSAVETDAEAGITELTWLLISR